MALVENLVLSLEKGKIGYWSPSLNMAAPS